MADINISTHPDAIAFLADLRARCEQARLLKAQIDSLSNRWFLGINTEYGTAADTVTDGRAAEGLIPLTAGDVTNAVSQLLKTATGQAAEWNSQILEKLCVRSL